VLGGEDSGHMIFAAHQTTGDGILSAIKLIEAMVDESAPLSRLKGIMRVFPQVLINVPVKAKPNIDDLPGISQAIREVEQKLGEKGRVLVRYSGTETLCRVMVEGPDPETIRAYGSYISDAIKAAIGYSNEK
jgi:phosphoglucosamine mutase